MDVLTGDGQVVTCSRTSTPTCSSGSPTPTARSATHCGCGIELEPVPALRPRCTHVRFGARRRGSPRGSTRCAREHVPGRLRRRHLVQPGRGATSRSGAGPTSRPHRPATTPAAASTTGRSSSRATDWLTVRDYLWRWDTDWFWCSRAFGVQHPAVRRLVPRRWLRSDIYWRLRRLRAPAPVEDALGPSPRPARARGGRAGRRGPGERGWPTSWTSSPARCRSRRCGSARCASATTRSSGTSTLSTPTHSTSTSASGPASRSSPARPDGTHDRLVERLVAELGGRKSLYSTSLLRRREEFWQTYGGAVVRACSRRRGTRTAGCSTCTPSAWNGAEGGTS